MCATRPLGTDNPVPTSVTGMSQKGWKDNVALMKLSGTWCPVSPCSYPPTHTHIGMTGSPFYWLSSIHYVFLQHFIFLVQKEQCLLFLRPNTSYTCALDSLLVMSGLQLLPTSVLTSLQPPHNLYRLLSLLNGEWRQSSLLWHLRPLRLWLHYLLGLRLSEFLASHAGRVMPITYPITCSSL